MITQATDEQMTEYAPLGNGVPHQKPISLKEAHTGRLSEIEDWYDTGLDILRRYAPKSARKGLRPTQGVKVRSRRRQNLRNQEV
jgi:hypothetical protein